MGKLASFNFISLNGFYKGLNNDISWNQHNDGEEGDYAADSSQQGASLIMGRITYEMMASFWPSEVAFKSMPVVADGMNKSEKIVFSTTLTKPGWNNVRVVEKDLVGEIKKLKAVPGKDLCVLGSGTILAQLAEHNLIDEYQLMLNPVLLADGTSIFAGMKNTLGLQLIKSSVFRSGTILLNYKPVR